MRQGVVLFSTDPAVVTFVRRIVENAGPACAPLYSMDRARTCAAAIAGSRRRRLVIIADAPPDRSIGTLVEAMRLVDAGIPIVLVGTGRGFEGTHRLTILPAPFLQPATRQALQALLVAERS